MEPILSVTSLYDSSWGGSRHVSMKVWPLQVVGAKGPEFIWGTPFSNEVYQLMATRANLRHYESTG